MTCDEVREEYETFALGVPEPELADELRAHLRRDCPNCVSGVRRALALIASLASIVNTVEPPARLRKRIIAAVNPALLQASSGSRFGLSVLLGAFSVVLLALVSVLTYQVQHLAALRQSEQTALRLVSAPDSIELTFGGAQPRPPRGRVFVNPAGVLLFARNLPRLEAGQTFEMWIIPKTKGAAPRPAGTFSRRADGSASNFHSAPVIPSNVGAIAVTVEEEGGAPAPTSTPIIAVPAE